MLRMMPESSAKFSGFLCDRDDYCQPTAYNSLIPQKAASKT